MMRFVLMIVCALSVLVEPSAGQMKDRRLKTTLADEEVTTLREAWERGRNPSVLVTVGVQDNRSIDFGDKSEPVMRLEKLIAGEIARAFPGSVRDLESSRKQDDAIIASMRRAIGTDAPEGLDEQLRATFDVDLRFEVVLRRRGSGLFTESFEVRDLYDGSIIASDVLNREGDVTSRVGADRVFAAHICGEFIDPFVAWATNTVRTYQIRALAQARSGESLERTLRRLHRDIERSLDRAVKWARVTTEERDGVLSAILEVRYDGELDDLLFDIEDYILEDRGLGWDVIKQEGRQAGVFIFQDERPDWHILTDASDPVASARNARRRERLQNRRLSIVIGSDLQDSSAYFASGTGGETAPGWGEQALRAALINAFGELGVTVNANDALRARINGLRGNAERYDNVEHLLEALGELQDLDYVLHVNIPPGADDGRFIARLYDPADASEIALQTWPAASTGRLSKYSVDESNPDEIARYVAGRLAERWDRRLADNSATTVIQVRNHDGGASVLGLVNTLRDGVPGVQQISSPQISGAAASFDVVHAAQTSEIMLRAIDRISTAYPGAEIQLLSGVLIVNMAPSLLSEEQLGEIRARRIALAPDEPEPAPLPAETPPRLKSEHDRVVEALRGARDSVWVIYIETPDSSWTGTGWTVADGLLATNAHVVSDVPERLARGEKVIAVAFNDSGRERRLTLGRAHRHPRFKQHGETSDFFFDVGLFEVVEGDPGSPLPVAGLEELDAIVPPLVAGYVGFPAGGAYKAEGELQNKQAFVGQLNSVVDVSLVQRSSARDKMLMHNIQSSGGASGSPIIGPSGRVIGLHNSSMTEFEQVVGADRPGEKDGGPADIVRVPTGYRGGVRVDILSRYMKSLGL